MENLKYAAPMRRTFARYAKEEEEKKDGRGKTDSCGRKLTFRFESVGPTRVPSPILRPHPFPPSKSEKNRREFVHRNTKEGAELEGVTKGWRWCPEREEKPTIDDDPAHDWPARPLYKRSPLVQEGRGVTSIRTSEA